MVYFFLYKSKVISSKSYPSEKIFGLLKTILSVQRLWKIDSAPEHPQQ